MSSRRRPGDELAGNDSQRPRLAPSPRRHRSDTRELGRNPTYIDLELENQRRRQRLARERARERARTATTTSTTLSRRLLLPATTSTSSSGGSQSSLAHLSAPLHLATSTTSSYGLPNWPTSASSSGGHTTVAWAPTTSRSATSVASSAFAMPARSSTSVVHEWAPTSSSYSPFHSATLTTSSAPSASSSAASVPSSIENRRLTNGANRHFMLRSPGRTVFLHSYSKADKTDECCVCLDYLLDNERKLIVASCGHLYHDKCLREWHDQEGHTKCLLCNEHIDKIAADIKSSRDFTVQQYPWSMFSHPKPQ